MNKSKQTPLARANLAYRSNDIEKAIALYEKALIHAEEPLKPLIRFNLQLAKLRSQEPHDGETKPLGIENVPLSSAQSGTGEVLRNVMHDIKAHFDSDFYRAKYQDTDQAGVDPLWHYCTTGWTEKRDPRSDFSTATYLEMNPDVAAAGINPFWHYVVAGKAEGRETSHPGGYKVEILKTLPSLDQIVRQWRKPESPPESMTAVQVARLLAHRITSGINCLAISVGHDHYKKISGGIQLCIQREEQLAKERGVLYLNVHPWQPLPILASATEDPDPMVALVLAGQDIGVCHTSVLTQALNKIEVKLHGAIYVIVHSLLGHAIEQVKDWVGLRKDRRCWFWLHDFFSLCPSYALQRNNISFCDAPAIDSNACAICIYGDERRSHMRRITEFFENATVTAIAPSEVTKRFWLSKANNLTAEVKILPHMEMPWLDREKPIVKKSTLPISIAFLGGPVYHKGWNVFEKLTQNLEGDPRYRFVYLGKSNPHLSGLQRINVHVTSDDYFAMTRAVSEAQIDYVLHWATWPETFSFTTYEAIAGGAYVLTNPISGNVAATVADTGMGAVFPDEQALVAFFKEGAAEQMAKTIRSNNTARVCKPRLSEMSIPLLMNEGAA